MRTPSILLATTVVLLLTAPSVVGQAAVTNPGDHITLNGIGAFVVKGPALFVSSARTDLAACIEEDKPLKDCEARANILPNTFAEGEWTVVAAAVGTPLEAPPISFEWSIAGWVGSVGVPKCLEPGVVVLTLDRTTLTSSATCL